MVRVLLRSGLPATRTHLALRGAATARLSLAPTLPLPPIGFARPAAAPPSPADLFESRATAIAARALRVRTDVDALRWFHAAATLIGWQRGSDAWQAHAAARRAGEWGPPPTPAVPAAVAAALQPALCQLLRRFATLPQVGSGSGGGSCERLEQLISAARLTRALLPGQRFLYQHPFRGEAAALQYNVVGGDAVLRAWAAAGAPPSERPPAAARLEVLVDLLQCISEVTQFTPAIGISCQATDAAIIVAVREGALGALPLLPQMQLAHTIFAAHDTMGIACPALWFAMQPPLLSLVTTRLPEGLAAGAPLDDGSAIALAASPQLHAAPLDAGKASDTHVAAIPPPRTAIALAPAAQLVPAEREAWLLQRLSVLAFRMSRTNGLDPRFAAALLRLLHPLLRRLAAAAPPSPSSAVNSDEASAAAPGSAMLVDAARRLLLTLVDGGTPVGMLPAGELSDAYTSAALACEELTRRALRRAARRNFSFRAAAEREAAPARPPPPAAGSPSPRTRAPAPAAYAFARVGGVLVCPPSRDLRDALSLIHALCSSGVALPLRRITAAGRALIFAELQPYARWTAADVGRLAAERDRPSQSLLRVFQMLHQLFLWGVTHGGLPPRLALDGAGAPAAMPASAAAAAPAGGDGEGELMPAWVVPLAIEAMRLAERHLPQQLPQTAAASSTLATPPPGGSTRSAFEALTLRLVCALCARRGVPAPLANFFLPALGVTVDMAWPAQGVAVEADGPFHFTPRTVGEHAAVLAGSRGSRWDAAAPEASAWLVARSPRGPCELWHVTSERYHPRMLLRHRALLTTGWAVARVRHFDLFPDPFAAGGGAAAAAAPAALGGVAAPPSSAAVSGGVFGSGGPFPIRSKKAMLASEEDGLAVVDAILERAGVWARLLLHDAAAASTAAAAADADARASLVAAELALPSLRQHS